MYMCAIPFIGVYCSTLAEGILTPPTTVGHAPILGTRLYSGLIIDFELVF